MGCYLFRSIPCYHLLHVVDPSDIGRVHFAFPSWENIWGYIGNVRKFTENIVRELYRVSLSVMCDVILLSARGTNVRLETPITAQLAYPLLFVPFWTGYGDLHQNLSPCWKNKMATVKCYMLQDRGNIFVRNLLFKIKSMVWD